MLRTKQSELVLKMSDKSFQKLWHQFTMRIAEIQLLMGWDENYERPTSCSIHNILEIDPNFLKSQLKFSLDKKRAILSEIYDFQERIDLLLCEDSKNCEIKLMPFTRNKVPFDFHAEEI